MKIEFAETETEEKIEKTDKFNPGENFDVHNKILENETTPEEKFDNVVKTPAEIQKIEETVINTPNSEITDEEIDLTAFKDVFKETIFKKTVSKLFDESVKEIRYFPKENFLHVDCKAYLFKFGSYKLDENNCFIVKDKIILDEFFTRVNLTIQNSLTIYANFIA